MEADITPYIRFRLGNIDSYQGTPTNLDRDDFAKVPVIRIWGAVDDTGQKVATFVSWQTLLTTHRYVVMFTESTHIATSSILETWSLMKV
jgi:hypothetical protein